MTSHIDIAPTVLSLMGRETSKNLYQGESILNPILKERVTFFWGGHYFGTNAMHYQGKFYMENIVTGVKLLNDNFMFENDTIEIYDEFANYGDGSINFTGVMNKQKSIQYNWAAYMRGRN